MAQEKGRQSINVQELIEKGLCEIVWLRQKKYQYTEDEIPDIVSDLKPFFEEHCQDITDFDIWYDEIDEEIITPYLQQRRV